MTIAPPSPSVDWAYFLDVDGTLIDIAPTPEAIFVDPDSLRLIENLHSLCNGAVALVSGRAIADLDARLGLSHLPMAGLHGLEWRDASGIVRRQTVSQAALRAIAPKLTALQQRYEQLVIENKGMAIALHYRQAPRLGSYLHRRVNELASVYGDELQVQPGKRVIEIKPRGHDKGSAITSFMTQEPFAGRNPVFIGDDLTDEHGFTVVNRMKGVAIKVGSGRTHAPYRLPNVAAVLRWLGRTSPDSEVKRREENIAIT